MDRSVLIKEATYRAFIDELEKISSSMSEEEWEKLARGLFERMGRRAKGLYEGAQVGMGNIMSGHHGSELAETANEALHHGGMGLAIDPSDLAHAATMGGEVLGAKAALMAAPAAARAIQKHGPRAVGFLKRKGSELAGQTRAALHPFIGGGGPPPVPGLIPAFAG